jgi:hypothetical protein
MRHARPAARSVVSALIEVFAFYDIEQHDLFDSPCSAVRARQFTSIEQRPCEAPAKETGATGNEHFHRNEPR